MRTRSWIGRTYSLAIHRMSFAGSVMEHVPMLMGQPKQAKVTRGENSEGTGAGYSRHGSGGCPLGFLRKRPLDDLVDLGTLQDFLFQQSFRKRLQGRHVLAQHALGALVVFGDESLDFGVDFVGNFLAVITPRGDLASQKDFF